MNKREVVWLIVKLIGTYFLYSAVVAFFALLGSISNLYSLSAADGATVNKTDANVSSISPVAAPEGIPMMTTPTPARQPGRAAEKPVDPATRRARDEAVEDLLWYIFLTAVYGALAFYLIRDGRVLFWMLNREGKRIVEKEAEISSLGILDDGK